MRLLDKKCGTYPYPLIADVYPEPIRKSVKGFLKRLRIECIDLYYQHRIDPTLHIKKGCLHIADGLYLF
ncbi:MAG: aldo/keto reductase [Ruminococcus sp.]|nr:aldo/keto reductase [Ruminococcus sp.]